VISLKIDTVELKQIAVRESQYPEEGKKEFLLVGRSNVGKSSFINALTGRKNYARTSSKPGKTQTLNFYLINNQFYLIDVPGYGYANTNKDKTKKLGLMIEEYLKKRTNLSQVFLLIDYRHKPSEDDILMYEFLKFYNKKVTVITTKYDKVNMSGRAKQDKIIKDALKLPENETFIHFSSVTKKGREEIFSIIKEHIELDEI